MTTTTSAPAPIEVPFGLDGVVVAETGVGDVRGSEGFFHYRQYSAVELAATRSFEDVWHLFATGALPDRAESAVFRARTAALRELPVGVTDVLATVAPGCEPLAAIRTALSAFGATLGWRPTVDIDAATLDTDSLRLVAAVPTIAAATWRVASGAEPVPPDARLGFAEDYLTMLSGSRPDPAHVRALEQYLVLAIDHGFNASTFTARVVTSTGADLAASVVAAIGALSGPLHGGAPSRALDMLDEIGTPERTDAHVRRAVASGARIMGFGHRVYRTEDPRAAHLRRVAHELGAPLIGFAERAEETVTAVLEELKPGRELHVNVEFYAGVVMDACGVPREMFTPTFAVARMLGWTAHIAEQAASGRIIRPSSRYVGPPPPVPVPPA